MDQKSSVVRAIMPIAAHSTTKLENQIVGDNSWHEVVGVDIDFDEDGKQKRYVIKLMAVNRRDALARSLQIHPELWTPIGAIPTAIAKSKAIN
jgi:hypothetical protein